MQSYAIIVYMFIFIIFQVLKEKQTLSVKHRNCLVPHQVAIHLEQQTIVAVLGIHSVAETNVAIPNKTRWKRQEGKQPVEVLVVARM